MNLMQNPITRTRIRLVQRTVGLPLAVVTALVVFAVIGSYLSGYPTCYNCTESEIALRQASDALTTLLVLQGFVAVFGPMLFAVAFYVYDRRAGVADAMNMAPLAARDRLWGEVAGIAATPFAVIGAFGLVALAITVFGQLGLGAEVLGVQVAVFGLAAIGASILGRALCSHRPTLTVGLWLLVVLFAIAGADRAVWWLPRIITGFDLMGHVLDASLDVSRDRPVSPTVWAAFAMVYAAQLSTLAALLFVRTPRTAAGVRNLLLVVVVALLTQLGLLGIASGVFEHALGIGAELSSYRFARNLMHVWMLGAVISFCVVAMLMPDAVERYRASVRGALGVSTPSSLTVYAAGVSVLGLFGLALCGLVSLGPTLPGPSGIVEVPPILAATVVAIVQLCAVVAFYELLAHKTGARAPVWLFVSVLGLLGVVFFGVVTGLDDEVVGLVPGVSSIVFLTDRTPSTEVIFCSILWFAVALPLVAIARQRTQTRVIV